VIQLALTLALIGFAGWQLWRQWSHASRAALHLDIQPLWLVVASLLVLGTYVLLIETWRRILIQLGAPVAFAPAARVWFVSNLGKYVPGKIWQVSAMAVMIGEYGVSLAAASASAVVITIANVATGFAVVLIMSTATVRQLAGGFAGVLTVTLGLVMLLLAVPVLAGQWNKYAHRFGRAQLSINVPLSAIWIALAGCALGWLLYGVAFQLFVRSIVGSAPGTTSAYIAAYTASYLIGYLTLFAPGGLGARELVLTTVLVPLGLATPAQAAVITVSSRLWLTALELLPSLAVLLRSGKPRLTDPQARGNRIP
jgi:glycosyltransferase 2 family protein